MCVDARYDTGRATGRSRHRDSADAPRSPGSVPRTARTTAFVFSHDAELTIAKGDLPLVPSQLRARHRIAGNQRRDPGSRVLGTDR